MDANGEPGLPAMSSFYVIVNLKLGLGGQMPWNGKGARREADEGKTGDRSRSFFCN